jgi:hypothetical protein
MSDLFKSVNVCVTSDDISSPNYDGICTDGAAALTKFKKGFQAGARHIAIPHVNFIRCRIHREALALGDLQPQLHTVLQEAEKVVNFAKARL